ncbi:signal recognition particle, SRP9/SRP14 subunit [Ascodesmis nigricans]|uniref:Signal recognition particle subunit SRP14 n=1 Tax=Ascodesmis nigricans TaxID=341454 RepID=A0A4S2N1I3_9PEZI|nr:signal recognition particle, SRP9/SRP14 subunit [Ascodesmis nigricans]
MPQERLSNDEFFTRLTQLITKATNAHKTSVFLTQKPLPPTDPSSTPSLLVRATDGHKDTKKKAKIATVVEAAELEGFYGRYAEVCKSGMGALKRRDRKRRKVKKGKEEKS